MRMSLAECFVFTMANYVDFVTGAINWPIFEVVLSIGVEN